MSSALSPTPTLAARYQQVRAWSQRLAAPLTLEDQVVQPAWFASPTKWHLGHTSWFFETFVLGQNLADYQPLQPAYRDFWNSYYNEVGPQIAQGSRGELSRPTVAQVQQYRAHVDQAMRIYLEQCLDDPLVELGLQHEQQHQELMLTDIQLALAQNPLEPVYEPKPPWPAAAVPPLQWASFGEGLREVGAEANGFSFDNEQPRHRVFVEAFEIATRPVTNAEYLEFVEAGGYEQPRWWLALGWKTVQQNQWRAPLYWQPRDGQWWQYSLAGWQPLSPAAPVRHLSYFEADAFARWAGARLPTEAEWETAAQGRWPTGEFAESERFRPGPVRTQQFLGAVWEWTASPYTPYPGFRPAQGALGEYNGKFMCNQQVLRGGSCATPQDHIRVSYRNFFPPELRWQFAGLRLARHPDR